MNAVTPPVTSQKGIGGSPGQYTIVVRVTPRWGKCRVARPEDRGRQISRKGMRSRWRPRRLRAWSASPLVWKEKPSPNAALNYVISREAFYRYNYFKMPFFDKDLSVYANPASNCTTFAIMIGTNARSGSRNIDEVIKEAQSLRVNIRVILQVICLIINTWCIPAKLRLPNDIFTHAGSRQEAVAVQLPKSPRWPPLARHILIVAPCLAKKSILNTCRGRFWLSAEPPEYRSGTLMEGSFD